MKSKINNKDFATAKKNNMILLDTVNFSSKEKASKERGVL